MRPFFRGRLAKAPLKFVLFARISSRSGGTMPPSCLRSVRRTSLGWGRFLRSNLISRPGDIAMRLFAALFSLVLLVAAPAVPAAAQDTPPPVKGMFLLTDYPAVTVRPGTTTTINLRLRNYALPPGALRAVGRRRAARLDRDAARRRPAGRRRDGRDQRQRPRCNCGSTCRRTPRWARRTSRLPPRASRPS